jgi:excisionase family DNA binding protein
MLLRLIRLQEQPRQLPPTPGEKPAPAINLSDKLLLSIPEASMLSGIPADKLRAAVKSRKLKAVQSVGRGLGKIKRSDLDAYVRKL